MLGGEVTGGIGRERAVVATNASDSPQGFLVLDTSVDETNDRENAENEHCGQHCGGERSKGFGGARYEPYGHERARKRIDVERTPSGRFADRGARSRLKHIVLGDQR